MADRRLRELERRARAGDREAERALAADQVRSVRCAHPPIGLLTCPCSRKPGQVLVAQPSRPVGKLHALGWRQVDRWDLNLRCLPMRCSHGVARPHDLGGINVAVPVRWGVPDCLVCCKRLNQSLNRARGRGQLEGMADETLWVAEKQWREAWLLVSPLACATCREPRDQNAEWCCLHPANQLAAAERAARESLFPPPPEAHS